MNIILGVYSVFASALIVWAFRKTFFDKNPRQKIYDSIDDTPSPAEQLTPKEKRELSDYIADIKEEPKLLNISAIDTLIDAVAEAMKAHPLAKEQMEEEDKPIHIPIKKEELKQVELPPERHFLKQASKHGIKKFIFDDEGKSITFTPEKIFRYGVMKYTMAGIEGYLQTEIHTVIYAVKYSDYFVAFLGNGEEVKIPTKVCKINSCDMLTIPDFKY